MDGSTSNRKRQLIATLAVLIVITVIVAAAVVANKKDAPIGDTGNQTTPTSTVGSRNSTYKDGTYSAVGGYNSPGGSETITISLTLEGNIIADTSATPGATNAEAEMNQDDFIAAYKKLVVGKNINEVELNRVAGASLTTIGFNNAIQQIKSKAEI